MLPVQRTISLTPLLFFLSLSLYAQPDPGIAVIIGENSAWTIESPEGWRLEPDGATMAGVGAAFIPADQQWSTAPSVLYGITLPKRSASTTIEDIMREDSARTAARRPGTLVRSADSLDTFQGVSAVVRHCISPDSTTVEAVAYINGPTAVALVVLSCRSLADFQSALPAFVRLVDSYEWITSDPAEIARIKSYR